MRWFLGGARRARRELAGFVHGWLGWWGVWLRGWRDGGCIGPRPRRRRRRAWGRVGGWRERGLGAGGIWAGRAGARGDICLGKPLDHLPVNVIQVADVVGHDGIVEAIHTAVVATASPPAPRYPSRFTASSPCVILLFIYLPFTAWQMKYLNRIKGPFPTLQDWPWGRHAIFINYRNIFDSKINLENDNGHQNTDYKYLKYSPSTKAYIRRPVGLIDCAP